MGDPRCHGDPTYTARTEDVGYRISVYATPLSPNFLSEGKRSNSSRQIYGKFTGMSAFTLKGTALPGQLLTAVPRTDSVSGSGYRELRLLPPVAAT